MNLLQPQDRRSREPGDAREAVDARAALLAAGVGRALVEAIAGRAAALGIGTGHVVVDLGSGSGDVLAAVSARTACPGIGIDLSAAAAEFASRRFTHLTWVVANADRRLPLVDGSASLVLSVNGRRQPGECLRVLEPGGWLLIALPGAEDLIELREAVLGERLERPRAERVVREHADMFHLVDRVEVRERHRLGPDALLGLLRATYRGARRSSARRIAALEPLELTLASDVMLFRR